MAEKLKVLLTGAAGQVGQCLFKEFKDIFALRTFDLNPVPGDANAVIGDLADYAAVRKALDGIEVVVHLGANPFTHAKFEDLVGPNFTGLHNVLTAAVDAKVRRVVFASTCQVMCGQDPGREVAVTEPFEPVSLYATTKAWGEVVGRLFHQKHKLEFIAVRIGWFHPAGADWRGEPKGRMASLWVGPNDLRQLFRAAVEKPGVTHAVVCGSSGAGEPFMSLKTAKDVLGYEPKDRPPFKD